MFAHSRRGDNPNGFTGSGDQNADSSSSGTRRQEIAGTVAGWTKRRPITPWSR